MNTLSAKLILAFSLLIAVLTIQILLNQSASSKVNADFERLESRINPTIRLLEKFQTVNNELKLLINRRLSSNVQQDINNRILEIIEVELPYFNSEVYSKISGYEIEESKLFYINAINELTRDIIVDVEKHNVIVKSIGIRNDKAVSGKLIQKSNDDLESLFFRLDNNMKLLNREYENEYLIVQKELSTSLSQTSNSINIAGVIGLIISLLIAYKTLRAVVKPIKDLQFSTQQIAKGNYDMRVTVKGNDELAQLANSFNSMADELKGNFDTLNEKNKELEQFIYIASHDLQEPLRTITSFTELLKVQYQNELDAKATKFLNFMSQSTKRMSDLITGLLDYSRIGKSELEETINGNNLLDEVLSDMAASIIKYDAHVEVKELPEVRGKKTELRLLFQNLISNAIKFRKEQVAPNVIISGKRDGDVYRFEVKDNGIGISAANVDKVFAIFQRLHGKDKFEGTGIGLAHCQKIVDLHGGKIWLESIEGVGTSFIFTLPA